MIEAKDYLQWIKSYINGMRKGMGRYDFLKDDWSKGALWALEKVDEHIAAISTFISLNEGKNNGREKNVCEDDCAQ